MLSFSVTLYQRCPRCQEIFSCIFISTKIFLDRAYYTVYGMMKPLYRMKFHETRNH